MKKLILTSIVSTMALMAVTLHGASLDWQHCDQSRLEGLWDAQVTNTDCNGHTVMAFRALEAFHQGGTFTTTGNANSPALSSPGLGTWQHTGMRTFNAPFQFFTFNPDGSFAGTVKIERQIHLSDHGNSYTGTSTFAFYDPNGNLLFQACGTETAVRLP